MKHKRDKGASATHSVLRVLLSRPIAFHRPLAEITGSVTAGLMLSQALYWNERTDNPDGWFYKSQPEWEEETTLSRREQESARTRLRQCGFWQEERRGVPARLFYRVDLDALAEALQSWAKPDSDGADKGECDDDESEVKVIAQIGGKRQSGLHASTNLDRANPTGKRVSSRQSLINIDYSIDYNIDHHPPPSPSTNPQEANQQPLVVGGNNLVNFVEHAPKAEDDPSLENLDSKDVLSPTKPEATSVSVQQREEQSVPPMTPASYPPDLVTATNSQSTHPATPPAPSDIDPPMTPASYPPPTSGDIRLLVDKLGLSEEGAASLVTLAAKNGREQGYIADLVQYAINTPGVDNPAGLVVTLVHRNEARKLTERSAEGYATPPIRGRRDGELDREKYTTGKYGHLFQSGRRPGRDPDDPHIPDRPDQLGQLDHAGAANPLWVHNLALSHRAPDDTG